MASELNNGRSNNKVDIPNFKHKLRGLVVDDSPVEQYMLKYFLNRLNVECTVAANGKEAVELILGGASFDLIIMDSRMPEMSGLEATRKLRLMRVRTKIVGHCIDDRCEAVQAFMDAGIDEFIRKPILMSKLASMLEEIDNNM